MSKRLVKTKSGIIVPTDAELHVTPCGYCPRMIVKEQELGKKYHLVDGKPMCMVDRAVNMSKFRKQIRSASTVEATKRDEVARKDQFEKQEAARLFDIAHRSQVAVADQA